MKILVTGAAGFIGSFLVEKLLSIGYRVVGIDNLSTGRLENLSNVMGNPMFRFIRADLLEPSTWIKDLSGVYAVFHLAANPEVRHSTREPLEHYHQNLTATMNVLEVSRRAGAKVFVFASSSTVYGDPETIPTPESHPIRPVSIYGATKAAGEMLCQTYSRLYGIKCLVLRYANIVGPRLGHGVIYDFIVKLIGNKESLEILGDGSQKKSYLHVHDAIEASIAAFNKILNEDLREEVYNIGNKDWISVIEIADEVINAMGLSNIRYIFKPQTPDGRGWPGDVKLMLLDISKIEKATAWKPSMNSREAIKRTAESLAKELIAFPH